MKKVLLLLSILMLPILLSAQDDDKDLPFENDQQRDNSRLYFVLAGGLTVDWLLISENNLNSFFATTPEELKLSGPINMIGGQGLTGIPWVDNVRIGVLGYGGSLESAINGDTQLSQSKLTASLFGFSVQYGYVPYEHLAFLAGVNAGWGDMSYEVFSGSVTVENSFSNYGTNRLEKDFFFVMPTIQVEYALANFIIIRADASYNLTVGQDKEWTYNTVAKNSVNPDFNISGFKIGFGFMVGLVNF